MSEALTRRDLIQRSSALGVLAMAPGLFAACGGAAAPKGQSFRWLVGEAFWANWDPYGHFSQVQFALQRNVFDRLVEVTPDLRIVPGLAESWKEIDAKTWEFKLRDGEKFHDGTPLTAKDVKASIEIASGYKKHGKDVSTLSAIWGVPHEGEVVDALTVRLHSKSPFAPLLNTLPLSDIAKAQLIEAGPDVLGEKPTGTGPFKLLRETSRSKLLVPHAASYRRAKLDVLKVDLIEDAQTRLNALLAREADGIARVRPDQIPSIDGRAGYAVQSVTSLEVQQLWIRKDKKPFDRAEVRRALAWGIDRHAVAKLVGGKAAAADSHLPIGMAYRKPQEPPYRFDAARAKAELSAAGFTEPIKMELLGSVGQYPNSKEATELIAENLQQSGFDVNVTVLEAAAFNERTAGNDAPHAFFSGWGNLTRDPDFAVSLPFHSPGAVTPENDEEADRLIDAGKTTTEEGAREEAYARLQAYLWQEQPTIPVIYSDASEGLADYVQGYKISPSFLWDFQRVAIRSKD